MIKNKKNFKLNPDFSVSCLPRVVRIEPSSFCNLRCIHCPIGSGQYKGEKGNMSMKVFNKIIKEIKKYKGVDVIVLYHGGEPFINKNIFKMIKIIKSIGVPFIKTVTNGTLFTSGILNKIIDSGLDSIEFSLDGLNPQENDRIRRGSNYLKVAKIIKQLLILKRQRRLKKPTVYIGNTQIPSKEDILKGKKVKPPQYLLDDFSDFKNEIKFKCLFMIKWPGFNCFNDFILLKPPRGSTEKRANYCEHVRELITVRWNGEVVPCCYDITSRYIIGNIMQNSLEEIWDNNKYKKIRQSIHHGRYLTLCKNCPVIKPNLLVVKKKKGKNDLL